MINTKNMINKCNEIGDLLIKEGVEFKTLALSLEQNKPAPDIAEFINKKLEKLK